MRMLYFGRCFLIRVVSSMRLSFSLLVMIVFISLICSTIFCLAKLSLDFQLKYELTLDLRFIDFPI